MCPLSSRLVRTGCNPISSITHLGTRLTAMQVCLLYIVLCSSFCGLLVYTVPLTSKSTRVHSHVHVHKLACACVCIHEYTRVRTLVRCESNICASPKLMRITLTRSAWLFCVYEYSRAHMHVFACASAHTREYC